MTSVFHWIGIGLTGFALGAVLWDDARFLRGRTRRVTGRVFDHRLSREDGDVNYAAQVRFSDADGREHEIVDGVLKPTPMPAVGTAVLIVYPESQPARGRIPRPTLRTAIYAVLVGLLVVLVLSLTGRIE